MSDTVIVQEKLTEIVNRSVKELRKKEVTNATKSATISNIVAIIEEVLSNEN